MSCKCELFRLNELMLENSCKRYNFYNFRLFLFQNLKLKDGSLSFHYWQKPGVIRLTKVYIFNVTNPDNFLYQGEKPKLQEIGPFVYR